MDKTVAGLLGVMGVMAVAAPGHAAPAAVSAQTVLQAQSYAELLRPVPNAVETLRALDTVEADRPALLEEVQYHHHHHHHRVYRRRVYHRRHHHHHHHHGILGAILR